jgi:hypothetical protein
MPLYCVSYPALVYSSVYYSVSDVHAEMSMGDKTANFSLDEVSYHPTYIIKQKYLLSFDYIKIRYSQKFKKII